MPVKVTLCITDNCNLGCKHCFFEKASYTGNELNTSQWISIIADIAEHQIYSVGITGGEPFLRPDIFELLDALETLDIQTSINTNGTLLEEESIGMLAAYENLTIDLSVYGKDHSTFEEFCGKDLFDNLCNSVRLMNEHHINYTIVCNWDMRFRTDVYEYIEHFANLGANRFYLHPIKKVGRAKSLIQKGTVTISRDHFLYGLARLATRHGIYITVEDFYNTFDFPIPVDLTDLEVYFNGCIAGKTKMAVLPNGDVVPCIVDQFAIVGNVLDEDLVTLWNKMDNASLGHSDECRSCPDFRICKGGCTAERRANPQHHCIARIHANAQ